MRNNAAKLVAGAWRSWAAGGRAGRCPEFTRPLVLYTFKRDWNLLGLRRLSLRTLGHRIRVDYVTSSRDAERLAAASVLGRIGGALLVKRKRGWFLNVSVELPDPPSWEPLTPVGVDRGVECVAVARALGRSPLVCSAGSLRHSRSQYLRTRRRLQAKGTPSSKRVLRRLSGREARLGLDTDRKAARAIAEYALGFERPILVLEKLTGVQRRCVGSKRVASTARATLSGWTYDSFLDCLTLAAESRGIPIEFVTPAWSSRTCPRCGDARSENRKGSRFHCRYCNYCNHADVVGATNLARRWVHEHALQPWGPVNGPDERGKMYRESSLESTPSDAQASGKPGGVDTPLPTFRGASVGGGIWTRDLRMPQERRGLATAQPYESDAPPG